MYPLLLWNLPEINLNGEHENVLWHAVCKDINRDDMLILLLVEMSFDL